MAKKTLITLAVSSLLFLILFFLSAVIVSQVLLRSESVGVPDVVGRTVAQARTELARKDLGLSVRGSEPSDRFERGLIVRQEPPGGARVRVGRAVQVTTSSGSENVTVPDVLNRPLDEALTLLREAGLSKGRLSQVHSSRFPAGRVIGQRPGAGSVIDRGSPVGLLVSQGELEDRYIMPDLIGLRADKVIDRFKMLGLKVADVRHVYYPGAAAGLIVRQEPPSGYRVHARNRISLEVSR